VDIPDLESEIVVSVEIPRGSRNKYEYEPELDAIVLERRLFTSTSIRPTTASLRGRSPGTATPSTRSSSSAISPSRAAGSPSGPSGSFAWSTRMDRMTSSCASR
jgi:hypothetical protein